jgi:hypothetical protein
LLDLSKQGIDGLDKLGHFSGENGYLGRTTALLGVVAHADPISPF